MLLVTDGEDGTTFSSFIVVPNVISCRLEKSLKAYHGLVFLREFHLISSSSGTKRLVSVNTRSVKGNLAGVFASKVLPGISYNKGKMNDNYFWRAG